MRYAHVDKRRKILGWYSKEVHGENIPTPNVEVTEENWRISCDNNHNKVNKDGTTCHYDFRTKAEKEQAKLEQEKREKEFFNQKISSFIDSKAQELQYDNMMSCTKYVGYDNPYRQECEDLLKWNAKVWEFVSQSEETDADKLIEQLKEI